MTDTGEGGERPRRDRDWPWLALALAATVAVLYLQARASRDRLAILKTRIGEHNAYFLSAQAGYEAAMAACTRLIALSATNAEAARLVNKYEISVTPPPAARP